MLNSMAEDGYRSLKQSPPTKRITTMILLVFLFTFEGKSRILRRIELLIDTHLIPQPVSNKAS